MPHITIEYSSNMDDHHDIGALVDAVHAGALAHGLPAIDALRTRAVARRHYQVADGNPAYAFVAIAARTGPGRPAATKRSYIEAVLDAAQTQLATEADSPLVVAWSIELNEIDPEFRINRNEVRPHLESRRSSGESKHS